MSQTNFKRTKSIIMPTLSHKQAATVYLEFTGKIFTGKALKGKENEKPADLCECINLQTGEPVHYMVPTIVKERLNEIKEYVGKCFEISKVGRREGKRYDDYSMYEIERPKKLDKAV